MKKLTADIFEELSLTTLDATDARVSYTYHILKVTYQTKYQSVSR